MALISFLLFRKNLGNLGDFFGQMVYPPAGKKFPVRLCVHVGHNMKADVSKTNVIYSDNIVR